jgi:hypothetical protein
MPAGRALVSKRSKAVLPPPTLSVAAVPKAVADAVVLRCVSAARGRVTARAWCNAQEGGRGSGDDSELFHGESLFAGAATE